MEYKKIRDYEYWVGRNGTIKNKHGKFLKPKINTTGVPMVVLYNGGKRQDKTIASLVAGAFMKQRSNKDRIMHIDHNPKNNNVSNLRWSTQRDITNHSIESGRRALSNMKSSAGSRKTLSKTVYQYDLKGNFTKEFYNAYDVQKTLGISQSGISRCCLGKSNTAGGYIWKYEDTRKN